MICYGLALAIESRGIEMTDAVAPAVTHHRHTRSRSERSRWLALIALCAGMLMIILDATIVNVALPSIQRDLRFSQANLAWVVNAYLIAFGGLLLLARAARRPHRPQAHVHGWAAGLHQRLAGVRPGPGSGAADRSPVRPGRRRRDDVLGDPGHDRHDVPGAPRAGPGRSGLYSFVASAEPRSACSWGAC